ncbi:hypothetical protein [Streptomyces sp. NPDC050738]|uniref:hypothetical protein n=1 Tax=Streptomyces sp. NPDC050738 TaxID=3154744 RepID=UPI0034142197
MSGSGQIEVDAPVLKTEGYHFFEVGQKFSEAVTGLQNGLTALEGTGTPPWGDDDLGEKFGVVYEGFRDGMYESMGSLAQRLAGIGMALTEMGVKHEANEDATFEMIKTNEDGLHGVETKFTAI